MKAKPEKKPQRSKPYDREPIVEEICRRLSEGEPLRQICREEGKPNFSVIYAWMNEDAAIAQRIARAREIGHEHIFEGTLEIADDATNDWMESNAPDDVGYKLNGEHVQRSKLRIETRLKLLAKWNPKKYGDKQQIEHSGNIGLEALVHDDDAK